MADVIFGESRSSSEFVEKKEGEEGTSASPQTAAEYKKKRKKLLMAASVEETCRSLGYNLVKVLGHGSYGSVFLCRSRRKNSDERCAVKVIDILKAEKIFVDKFLQRELEILLMVRHPFIVHVKSIVFRNQKYYIFMRFAEKGDLFDLISKSGRLDLARAKIWSAQIASAINYLHSCHIVHRDLKCENILITRNSNICLADFGFARQFHLRNGKPQELTTFCGTKHYASPEVISSKPYDPVKADVWAFGVVLFIMLTGTMPFLANNQKKIREYQLKEVWKSKINLPEDIMVIFRNVFALDQTKRWDTNQLKEADWYRMKLSKESNSVRTFSVQAGSEEYVRRIYSLKKHNQVFLPSLLEADRSQSLQSPSFLQLPSEVNQEEYQKKKVRTVTKQ